MVGGLRDAGYIESGRFDTRRFTVFCSFVNHWRFCLFRRLEVAFCWKSISCLCFVDIFNVGMRYFDCNF